MNFKRAHSPADKQLREQRIIEAAQNLLMEKGYTAIRMDEIVRAAGIAKGTAYLYFKSKEELFLAVYERHMTGWFAESKAALQALPKQAPPEQIARSIAASVASKPRLTRLIAITPLILEQNVSLERAITHKRWLAEQVTEIGAMLEEKVGLGAGQGLRFLLRLYAWIAGLEGLTHPAPVTLQALAHVPALAILEFETELYDLILLALHDSMPTQNTDSA